MVNGDSNMIYRNYIDIMTYGYIGCYRLYRYKTSIMELRKSHVPCMLQCIPMKWSLVNHGSCILPDATGWYFAVHIWQTTCLSLVDTPHRVVERFSLDPWLPPNLGFKSLLSVINFNIHIIYIYLHLKMQEVILKHGSSRVLLVQPFEQWMQNFFLSNDNMAASPTIQTLNVSCSFSMFSPETHCSKPSNTRFTSFHHMVQASDLATGCLELGPRAAVQIVRVKNQAPGFQVALVDLELNIAKNTMEITGKSLNWIWNCP